MSIGNGRPLELEDNSILSSYDDEDFQAISVEQRRELMAAKAVDSDLDLASNIQLQEAINASISLNRNQPSSYTSSDSPSQPQLNSQLLVDNFSNFTDPQSNELLKLEQEFKDHIISEIEFRNLKKDLHRMIHDHCVAFDISRMQVDEWEEWEENFEQPFGEGTSKGVNNEIFRIYFKGLPEDLPSGTLLGGIGVAICN